MALLLCGKNFSLYLCKTVRFWLAPRLSCFLLGFDSRCLLRGQLLSGHKSFGCGAVFLQASLGIRLMTGEKLTAEQTADIEAEQKAREARCKPESERLAQIQREILAAQQ